MPAERQIRVFVSSTFRDMHAEREELVKRVFPQLRKLCEARGVAWSEVDLRWGVTDEQKAEGKVLPICLAEIQNCRPFFIGLLGERYGWVPDEISPDLLERESWLAELRDRSVTELEILHGVLNNPAMADQALFYFRDPAYLDSIAREQRTHFLESVSPEEVAEFGTERAAERAADRRAKLSALKQRIRESGLPLRENYATANSLGEQVFADLKTIIDRRYPEGSAPGPLEKEAAEHDAYARSRARVYIARKDDFERLDEHVERDGPPLVILGESGSGKSALLANWALQYLETHPEETLIQHYLGASPQSADWAAMLRRLMGEFQRIADIEEEIPSDPQALRSAFAVWLRRAAAKRKIILIIDALNQLEDRDGAPDLVWLPLELPKNVHLIVSCLPGRSLEAAQRRCWLTLSIKLLDTTERSILIVECLRQFSKTLTTDHVQRIAQTPQCANPLYLRVLLEELRLYGDHATLDQRITFYLQAENIPDLYQRVLARWEQDYKDPIDLVGDAMSLIWASRRGLYEAELLDLLGARGAPLPRAQWSPLYLAAEASLVSRSGLIGFSHEFLRQAVSNAYLPTEECRRAAHLRIADYFQSRILSARKVDELPWALAEAREWPTLHAVLTDLAFFEAAWDADQFDVRAHWAQVEAHSPLRLVDAYAEAVATTLNTRCVWNVATLLEDTGHLSEALELREFLVFKCRMAGDRAALQAALGNQARILELQGNLEGALVLLNEGERLCRELGDQRGLQTLLGQRANVLFTRGDLHGAMRLYREQELVSSKEQDRAGLQLSLGNQGNVSFVRGDLAAALEQYRRKEDICRELADKDGLQLSLGNQANILFAQGDFDGAEALLKRQEKLCRELGNKHGLTLSLGNQAGILIRRGDFASAMRLAKEQERVCRESKFMEELAACLGNQALILAERGNLHDALACHEEAERIFREMGNLRGLSISLGNHALVLARQGDINGAMNLHMEAERLCRESDDKEGMATALVNQASLLGLNMGDAARGLIKCDEAIRILSAVPPHDATLSGAQKLREQLKNGLQRRFQFKRNFS